jgi:predicted small metal-binding protein
MIKRSVFKVHTLANHILAHLKQAPDMGGIKEDYIDNIQQN